jgi:hypothetical protein
MSEHRWDWSRLDPAARRQRWDSLVQWVSWLVENYDPWVKLPECWPRHEALRSELAFFQEWHREVVESGDPYDGTSWHSSLRSAAEAWTLLSTCRHEERPWRVGKATSSEAFQRHLAAAIEADDAREPESAPISRPRPRLPLPPERSARRPVQS